MSLALSAAVLEGCAHRIEARWPPPPTAGYIWDWEIEWDATLAALNPHGATAALLHGRLDDPHPAVRHADWRVRAEALVALAAAGADAEGSRAREAFARALADPKPSVRAAAAEGLAGLGAAAAPAVPSIAALLDDPQRDVRVAAARSLGELGPVAAPAREKLERAAATDPRQRVRREASRALDRLVR